MKQIASTRGADSRSAGSGTFGAQTTRYGSVERACPACGGKGVARCECFSGKVTCPACDGAGRVRGRLAVAREELAPVVRFLPTGALSGAFVDLLEPDDFDAAPDSWPVRLAEDTGPVSPPPALPEPLRPPLDPVTERILELRRQRFTADVHTIR